MSERKEAVVEPSIVDDAIKTSFQFCFSLTERDGAGVCDADRGSR